MPLDPSLAILINALAEKAFKEPYFVFLAPDPAQPFPVGTPGQLAARLALPAADEDPLRRVFPPDPAAGVIVRLLGPSTAFYLREFDADAKRGKGRMAVTMKVDEALRFASWREAVDLCQRQPSAAPMRRDGKPNRPLRAVAISIEAPDC